MFAKLFERILLNQVNEFIQKEKNLNGTQFGLDTENTNIEKHVKSQKMCSCSNSVFTTYSHILFQV